MEMPFSNTQFDVVMLCFSFQVLVVPTRWHGGFVTCMARVKKGAWNKINISPYLICKGYGNALAIEDSYYHDVKAMSAKPKSY